MPNRSRSHCRQAGLPWGGQKVYYERLMVGEANFN